MKYLCLIYFNENAVNTLPEDEIAAIREECFEYSDELRESGVYLAAEALESTRSAATLRIRDRRVVTTDGPFAETKEQLGGFFLIEARDFNEAIRIGSRIPPARLGCIEIRPIRERRRNSEGH